MTLFVVAEYGRPRRSGCEEAFDHVGPAFERREGQEGDTGRCSRADEAFVVNIDWRLFIEPDHMPRGALRPASACRGCRRG